MADSQDDTTLNAGGNQVDKPSEFKSTCCNASVTRFDASGGHKHWLGFQCTECGNQSPLSTSDLLRAMGMK